MVNEVEYIELGLACVGVREALGQGVNRRRVDQLGRPVFSAIEQLMM